MTTPTPDTTTNRAVTPRPPAREPGVWIRRTSTAATISVALAAAVLSWSGLTNLAVSVGVSKSLAWLFAVSTDGLILSGSLAVLHSTLRAQKAVLPWTVVGAGAALSVWGNVVSSSVQGVTAAVVHASAPVALLLSMEMLLRLVRASVRADQAAAQQAQEAADRLNAQEARVAKRASQGTAQRVRKTTASAQPANPTGLQAVTRATPTAARTTTADVDNVEFLKLRSEGLSYARVADQLGLSVSAAKRLGAKLTPQQDKQAA